MNRKALESIDALIDGSISREDFDELQNLLKSDPTAFEHYCSQAEIHGRLEWEFGDPQRQHAIVVGSKVAGKLATPSKIRFTVLIAMAALIILLLGVTALQFRGVPTSPGPGMASVDPKQVLPVEDFPVTDVSVARLTNARKARWADGALHTGSWINPGELHLLSGSAEISFDSGARVVLQAPARLDVQTAHHARLLYGLGTIHISNQASGFVLETPSSSFSDFNSSFSIAVDNDGATEVHVLRGLVEATPRGNSELVRVLANNEAVRMTNSVFLARDQVRYASDSFKPELPVRKNATQSQFLHWTFDGVAVGGSVPEVGNHPGSKFPAWVLAIPKTSNQASAEFIVGKVGKAVQLNGRGSFMSSKFPGVAGSGARTVGFWVRISPVVEDDHAYSMVAWGRPGNKMGEKWQIAWNRAKDKGVAKHGTKGAIRTEFGGGFVIGETDLRDGRWHHVAVVFLGGKSVDVATHIRHYIDGRLEGVSSSRSQTINTVLTSPESRPTYIGRRLEDDGQNTFKGSLDELYIFPAALTPEQIGQLYLNNTPPGHFVSESD